MNCLAWCELHSKFAAFATEARQHGFYLDEIQRMDQSLYEMSPFPEPIHNPKEEEINNESNRH